MNLKSLHNAGIIPDGNRRWSIANGLELTIGYKISMEKIAESLSTLYTLGVNSVSVYLLSKDNLQRQREDLSAVFEAEIYLFKELTPHLVNEYGLNVFHAGDMNLLPWDYQNALKEICLEGNGLENKNPKLYFCANYDPWSEISITGSANKNKLLQLESLWVPLELDFVIRTGGESRLSGFLPLQCKYAEFFFEPYMFPEITPQRINTIYQQFLSRERRFGR